MKGFGVLFACQGREGAGRGTWAVQEKFNFLPLPTARKRGDKKHSKTKGKRLRYCIVYRETRSEQSKKATRNLEKRACIGFTVWSFYAIGYRHKLLGRNSCPDANFACSLCLVDVISHRCHSQLCETDMLAGRLE